MFQDAAINQIVESEFWYDEDLVTLFSQLHLPREFDPSSFLFLHTISYTCVSFLAHGWVVSWKVLYIVCPWDARSIADPIDH